MGLDMYLRAERYVGGWEWADPAERGAHGTILAASGLPMTNKSPGLYVSSTVAYWRKVNAVHNWFVENCQDGVDECQRAYVQPEQVEELRDLCVALLEAHRDEDPEVAQRLAKRKLPPTSGFFFGSTEIDDWYWRDLEDTVDQLTRALDETPGDVRFEYQSSW